MKSEKKATKKVAKRVTELALLISLVLKAAEAVLFDDKSDEVTITRKYFATEVYLKAGTKAAKSFGTAVRMAKSGFPNDMIERVAFKISDAMKAIQSSPEALRIFSSKNGIAEHDCDNCELKGKCPIEEPVRNIKNLPESDFDLFEKFNKPSNN